MSYLLRSWFFGFFCLVLSGYGCGPTTDADGGEGGGGGGGGGGGDSVSFDNYCDDFAQMTCQAAQRCDCLGGLSIDLCITYQTMGCDEEVTEPVEAGRVSYDSAKGGQCLSQLQTIISDCSLDDAYWPEACDLMLVGLVSEGGYCDGDNECQGSMECYDDECVVLPSENQSCHPDYDCADDLYCGEDDICHQYRGDGESCLEGNFVCDDDLTCDSRTETCEPYVISGGSCAHDRGACDDDLYCDESDVCQAQGMAGDSCGEDEQGLSDECVDGVCEADEESDCPFL